MEDVMAQKEHSNCWGIRHGFEASISHNEPKWPKPESFSPILSVLVEEDRWA